LDRCALCAEERPLTVEHVPPKSAFNKGSLIALDAAPWEEAAYVPAGKQAKGKTIQGGRRFKTLCAECNNFLGREYARSYAEWVYQIAELELSEHGRFILPFRLRPLRIVKAIVAMFLSVNAGAAPKFCDAVRQFLLLPRIGALPPEYRVFVYACSGKYLRMAPVHAMVTLGKVPKVYSEIACRPLGCVLSLDGQIPDPRMIEITEFKLDNLESHRTIFLQMPHFRLDSPIPLDFRSWDELERTRRENEQRYPGIGFK
jgi:hypothetical protein